VVRCGENSYEADYGTKEVEGVLHMTGPGIRPIQAAGMIQGGGNIPGQYVFTNAAASFGFQQEGPPPCKMT
jgi:hypothetical protein